jgi:hypothetical protein
LKRARRVGFAWCKGAKGRFGFGQEVLTNA